MSFLFLFLFLCLFFSVFLFSFFLSCFVFLFFPCFFFCFFVPFWCLFFSPVFFFLCFSSSVFFFYGTALPLDRPALGPPTISLFLSLSRRNFRSFFSLLGVLSWNCGRGPPKMRVWAPFGHFVKPGDTLPAYCISKVVVMKSEEIVYKKVYVSPRPPPKISYKDMWMCDLDSDVAGSSKDTQRIQPKPKTQLSSTERPVCGQESKKGNRETYRV